MWSSEQEDIKYIATNNDSLHINETSTSIAPTLMTKTCNSVYLITHDYTMFMNFEKHGFNLPCNDKEEKQLRISKKRTETEWSKGYPKCKKYEHSNPSNSPFCNGGKIIYHGNAFADRLQKRLTVKTHLNRILTAYCNKYHTNENVCNFHLLSFDMSIEKERIEFLSKHIDCNKNEPQYDQTWVFKENKNMGVGIHIFNKHQLIYRLIVNSSQENIKNCTFNPVQSKTFFQQEGFAYKEINEGYIVSRDRLLMQTFIANPLLINIENKYNNSIAIKHVFHLRSYFLVASFRNPFVVLHWPKFVLFINPYAYNNKDKMNRKAMTTNRHINSTHAFEDDNYEWMWGRGELQRYLDHVYGDTLFGGNYTRNKLNSDLMHILKEVFRANKYYKDKIVDIDDIYDAGVLYFDQYCMDIYINDKFELKLLEINPYCGTFCKKKKRKRKIQNGGIYDWDCYGKRDEATKIVLEIFKKKSNNETIEKIESLNEYQVAVWE